MGIISRFLPLLCLAGLGLGGCTATQDLQDKFSATMYDFNPMGTAKRPLPGDRKAMFPEGVPGVQQGIPNELLPGQQTAATEAPMIAAPAAPEPKARTRARRQRPVTTTATVTTPAARPPRRGRRAAPPASDDPPPDAVWPAPPAAGAQQQAPAPQRPARTAASPQPAPAPAGGGWQAPSSQPVPTIWPDPPKP